METKPIPATILPPIAFVENKPLDLERIRELLAPSIKGNHYTNFGPVSLELESVLARLNGLTDSGGASACCAASATVLIAATASALDNHFGRRLTWLTSDFGFFTNFTGPMNAAIHVSCDARGMLDLERAAEIDPASYDVIFVTNVFGLVGDFEPWFAFAREMGKVLVLDNAAGFGALSERHAQRAESVNEPYWIELVSLHHTKPWGMGEGGVAFVPPTLLPLLRASLNFGIYPGSELADVQWCANGKMSEFAAAAILARALEHETWTPAYREQAIRILRLGKEAGLSPLFQALPQNSVAGQVAFLAEAPFGADILLNDLMNIQKYYRPSRKAGPLAHSLYGRMLNVPCHGEMARLDDGDIRACLSRIARLTSSRVSAE